MRADIILAGRQDDMADYEKLGTDIGKLVQEKQQAYGDTISKTGAIMRILYPAGVSVEKLGDMLLVVRVLDKLCRLADGEKTAFGESPWRDIAGYGLLGLVGLAKDTKGEKQYELQRVPACSCTDNEKRPSF